MIGVGRRPCNRRLTQTFPVPLPGGRGFLPGSKRGPLCASNHFSASQCLSCFSALVFWSPFNTSRCTCIRSCGGEGNQIRKQAAKAERMARSVSDAEISERFLNMAKAYRSQADVLKVKKKGGKKRR